jgi:hypothetical protein
MGNIVAGITGHVLAFKQNVPDDLLQLFYPLPPDRLPEIIQMVLIAPTNDINHAKALARKCPAFIVRGELVYMWCIAITQALEKIGAIPNVQVRFLRRTAEAYSSYKKDMNDSSIFLDGMKHFKLLSELFDMSIYFIDAFTLRPIKLSPHVNVSTDKCVLLYVEHTEQNTHVYDVMGVVEDTQVRRTFDKDEALMRKISMYVHDIDRARLTYKSFA